MTLGLDLHYCSPYIASPHDNEIYGRVLRTHENVKPIFLSIGNMIDLETATTIVEKLVTKESHIPVPTRYADIMTHEVRKNMLSSD